MLNFLTEYAHSQAQHLAVAGLDIQLSYPQLQQAVHQAQASLLDLQTTIASSNDAGSHKAVALALDNHPAWIVLDLALLSAALTHVPIPAFFSDSQKQHVLQDAGVSLLLTTQPENWLKLCPQARPLATLRVAALTITALQIPSHAKVAPVAKITYTSGTTGQPKGVCLTASSLWQVAQSVREAVGLRPTDRHCCVLPLATLLENVAGVYATLLAGGTVFVYSSQVVGLSGSEFEVQRLYQALHRSAASTAILIPELLRALVQWLETGQPTLESLRFLAVGGARVAPALLQQALTLGLPVFEGYGLSECASVVTLNTSQAHKLGSIGKALPHAQLRLDAQGELWVKSPHFLGYTQTNDGLQAPELDDEGYLPTGDIAYRDDEGFWFLQGRKKHLFITSFGRNVSPEWPESALTQHPCILQACVFGEAQPYNVAVLVVAPQTATHHLEAAIQHTNANLPDYARIGRWCLAHQAFTPNNGQLTTNGRLKRDNIWQAYSSVIAALYEEPA